MKGRIILVLAVFLLAANICSAYNLESYTARYSIVDYRVVVQSAFTFAEPASGEIGWPVMPDDIGRHRPG